MVYKHGSSQGREGDSCPTAPAVGAALERPSEGGSCPTAQGHTPCSPPWGLYLGLSVGSSRRPSEGAKKVGLRHCLPGSSLGGPQGPAVPGLGSQLPSGALCTSLPGDSGSYHLLMPALASVGWEQGVVRPAKA